MQSNGPLPQVLWVNVQRWKDIFVLKCGHVASFPDRPRLFRFCQCFRQLPFRPWTITLMMSKRWRLRKCLSALGASLAEGRARVHLQFVMAYAKMYLCHENHIKCAYIVAEWDAAFKLIVRVAYLGLQHHRHAVKSVYLISLVKTPKQVCPWPTTHARSTEVSTSCAAAAHDGDTQSQGNVLLSPGDV